MKDKCKDRETKIFEVKGRKVEIAEIICRYHDEDPKESNTARGLLVHWMEDDKCGKDLIIHNEPMPKSDADAASLLLYNGWKNSRFEMNQDGMYHIGKIVGSDEHGNLIFSDGEIVKLCQEIVLSTRERCR